MIKSKEQFTMELCHKIEKDIANDWYSPTEISRLVTLVKELLVLIKTSTTREEIQTTFETSGCRIFHSDGKCQ